MDTFPSITVHDGSEPKESIPNVLRHKFGEGYTQRVGLGVNPISGGWDLVFTYLTPAQKEELETFLVAKGGVTAFYWTPPWESTPKVYTSQKWKFPPHDGGFYTGTVELMLEFDLVA